MTETETKEAWAANAIAVIERLIELGRKDSQPRAQTIGHLRDVLDLHDLGADAMLSAMRERLETVPEAPTQRVPIDRPNYRAIAVFLWDMLDDIDTAGDVAKGNHALYRRLVAGYHKRRFEVAEPLAYTLRFQGEPGDPSTRSRRRRPGRRRRSRTEKRKLDGYSFHVTIGFYADGQPCEVFADAANAPETVDAYVDDGCMVLSWLYQHGAHPRVVAEAMRRDKASAISAVADVVADACPEWHVPGGAPVLYLAVPPPGPTISDAVDKVFAVFRTLVDFYELWPESVPRPLIVHNDVAGYLEQPFLMWEGGYQGLTPASSRSTPADLESGARAPGGPPAAVDHKEILPALLALADPVGSTPKSPDDYILDRSPAQVVHDDD